MVRRRQERRGDKCGGKRLGARVYTDDRAICGAISLLIERLPEDVRDFVETKCTFLYIVNPSYDRWFSSYARLPGGDPADRPAYLIHFIGENPVVNGKVEPIFLHDVALNIAYAWLRLDPNQFMPTPGDETEADGLYASWGFCERFGGGEYED